MLAVHGAILFVFFGFGGLVLLNTRWWLSAAFTPHHTLPLFVIVAFSLSMLLNAVLGIVFSYANLNLRFVVPVLLIVHATLIVRLWRHRGRLTNPFVGALTTPVTVLLAYGAVLFLIMLANGGVIDILADSWWHMSLAKKIELGGSVLLDRHHLTGASYAAPTLVYEPGLHVSLSYILAMTGAPAPSIWHALAPWCVTLLLSAYFLLAERVTGNPFVAVVAVALMTVLFGGLNSYFRVSPWPANLAYALWYFLLFVTFCLLESYAGTKGRLVAAPIAYLRDALANQRQLLGLWVLGVAAVAVLHMAELLWYALSIVFYGIVLLGLSDGARSQADLHRDRAILGPPVLFVVGASVVIAWLRAKGGHSVELVFAAMLGAVLAYGQVFRLTAGRWATRGLIAFLFVQGLFFLIDFDHVQALFYPRYDSFSYYAYYIPEWEQGYFDDLVRVPHWEHQLRGGLLFAGLAGVAASIYLFFRCPRRGTVFLFANAVIPLLLLMTPYLFSYLFYFIPDRGVYRISLLIFHPICLAYTLHWLLVDAGVLGARRAARDA